MLEVSAFFATDERVQVWRPGECAEDAKCVLYWMQRAQRGQDNHALNAAIALGNQLKLPVIVVFVLTEYPAANLRHYTFMLEGLAVVARMLRERGTPLVIRRGSPADEIIRAAHELNAAAVISDMSELRTPRSWRTQVQQRISIPFVCVDTDNVAPMKFFPKEEWAARTLRPKLEKLLPRFLQPIVDIMPDYPLQQVPYNQGEVDNPLHYLTTLQIDHGVKPSQEFRGGQDEGRLRIQRFINERLTHYPDQKNHPEIAGTSELSAYLHYGQISVQQLAWDIEQHVTPETKSAHIDISSGKAVYLEELIVRAELAANFAYHNPHYDKLEGCPGWALATLKKHMEDPRSVVYSRDELELAQTHDELWNASQREMVQTGRMHGYMRMYWAKKILEWTETPEEAFSHAVYLNDKYELDGRSANGYTGIAWAIGGKHDRPWGPERPIFGLVRYMTLSGMQRKMDTRLYIHRWGANPLQMKE
jgi:deoxyribodipyrimidine photo-lyase